MVLVLVLGRNTSGGVAVPDTSRTGAILQASDAEASHKGTTAPSCVAFVQAGTASG